MYKVLLINGSPRKSKSCTMRIANKFVEGIKRKCDCTVETVTLADCNIKQCTGCLSCWGRTAGECVIRDDDIHIIKEKVMEADIIIESFPLYFFGMPGTVKVFTDRMLSIMNTYNGQLPVVGEPFHGFRYDMSGKKFVVVSTCGYAQTDLIYDPMLAQYDCICGKGNYYPLLCPQGKLLSVPELWDRMEKFIEKYAEAGGELIETGKISDETIAHLSEAAFSEHKFKLLLDLFWHNEESITNV